MICQVSCVAQNAVHRELSAKETRKSNAVPVEWYFILLRLTRVQPIMNDMNFKLQVTKELQLAAAPTCHGTTYISTKRTYN